MEQLNAKKVFLNIDYARKLAELSIEEVASLCGVTPHTYKRWRTGTTPRKSRLVDLENAFTYIFDNHDIPRLIKETLDD